MLPADAGFVASDVTGIRKAAILMMALGDDLTKMLFQSLTQRDVERVTEEITRLGEVPPETLTQVLTEFYGLLETQQYMVRGGPEYATRLLTDAFGTKKAQELMDQVLRMRERGSGDLAQLQQMDPQQLGKFLESEQAQTAALVLAHLDSKKAATVLGSLSEERRVEAVRKLAEMRQFSPEMAQKVALVLNKRTENLGQSGRKTYSGYKAVADILNGLEQQTSKGILEKIETEEPNLAINIRNLMFTFEDLLTVPAASIRELIGAADKRVLTLALKGANDNIKAHLFQAMSSRAVEMLKEDMEAMGPVRSRDVSQAKQELLALAQKLEAEGKIMLRLEAEDVVTL
ncbi:MAG: flagellar motor switch protein FliG [Acidobacteriota bacterium]|nr:flagellar motor switch protein FliG [Acidobacteriota bacterium]